ncbi:zinc finger CCHC domain-containing protein 17-like isoform X2 [Lycorma delicatula]
MVHKSQLSSVMVNDATDVLQKGDRVWCKIISISDDGKIALSMKVVNQGTGKDLDPTGVQIHQDELKRKEKPNQNRRKAIELGAILDTTCTKCGTRGHLSKDCFKTPDGKTYELIPEDDNDCVIDNSVTITSDPGSGIVKDKKRKKKKDKKSRDKDKAKKKKKKSKKKRKYSSSSDSSSEDSSSEQSSKKQKLVEKLKANKKR